jgi:hypothetical protein
MAINRPLTTPFRDLLPPLSTEENDALRASIHADGVRDPVLIDEDGNILDGHHRLAISPDAPVHVVIGSGQWSEARKEAFVCQVNYARRNLSNDQKEMVDAKRVKIAKALAAERDGNNNPVYTQAQIGALIGAARQTITDWLSPVRTDAVAGISSNRTYAVGNSGLSGIRRSRTKIPGADYQKIYDRYQKGESQTKIAADYKVTPRQISTICKKQERVAGDESRQKEAERRGRQFVKNSSIITGDFGEAGKQVPDGVADLVFTDPPYDKKGVARYSDLARFAARILRPGGSCIAYFGQHTLPDVLDLMKDHLRFWWTLAVIHTGATKHLTGVKVIVTWKPLLWFVKGTGRVKRDLVMDSIRSDREKGMHDWQQGMPEALYYVEKLTPAKGLVVDPFCGGGTTCLAAQRLGRRYLAFEKDEKVANRARGRLAQDGKG